MQLPDGTEFPATGKRIELRGMELVEVRDRKIVVDNLLRQHGRHGPARPRPGGRHRVSEP
jgi:hypothetical protein